MQLNHEKETLKNEQLEFILRQNYCLINHRRVNVFDPVLGGWHNPTTKSTRDYIDFVKRRYDDLLSIIYKKQPELKSLEGILFHDINSYKFFEKHFISVFQSKIYSETLSSLFFKRPYDSLPHAEFKDRIEKFINNSEFMQSYVHKFLLTAPVNKNNFSVFESYVSNLKKIPISEEKEFFQITFNFSVMIKSETLNKKMLKEVTAKFGKSKELKDNLLKLFQPFLPYHHDLRNKLNDYMVKTYNYSLTTENPKMSQTETNYQMKVTILTSSFVDNYKLSSPDADKLALKFLVAIEKSLSNYPEYSKSQSNRFSFSNNPKEIYGTLVMSNLEDFFNVSKYIQKIEEFLPTIAEHVSGKEVKTIEVNDLFKFIQDGVMFNNLKVNLAEKKEEPKPKLNKI